jgi:hypothetical protein
MATRKTSSKSPKKAAKTKADPVVIPPWPGIADDVLRSLAEKIDKAKDSYRISDMIRKVNGDDWGQRLPIAWHLVACRAIHPETNRNILEFLGDDFESAAPEVLVDLLVRLPDGSSKRFFENSSLLMDGYSITIDNLLYTAYSRAPDLVRARENELNQCLRRGLAFVRRRLGETISSEDSADILQQLARYQTRGYGLTTNNGMPVMENGVLVKPRLADLAAVKKLALLFGAEKEWNDLLLAGALEGKWHNPKEVRDAFLLATTTQLAQLVGHSSIDTGETLRMLCEIIPQREDDPNVLLEAALTVEDNQIRELLFMGVVYRAGKLGQPIAEKLDEVLTGETLDTTYEGVRPVCIEWFKYFPRDRALALARKLLAEEYRYSRAVAILASHFDEGILQAALEKDVGKNYIGQETLGGLGAQALPFIARAYDRETPDGQRSKHRAMLFAMGKAGESGPLDAQWDRFIHFDTEGGKPIQYYSSTDSKPREQALRGVPEPRRSALMLEILANTANPDRILQMAHLAEDPKVVETVIRRIIETRKIESGFRESVERLGEPAIAALCNNIGLSQGDGRFIQSLKNQLSHTMCVRIDEAIKKAGLTVETPKDALIRMANSAAGPKLRIYVLQVDREGYDPKPGTLARSGGKAPGIADKDIPKDQSGEPLTHLFTLDLDEIPELQEGYSGARALAVYCPEPGSGDRTDELQLVPVSAKAVAALPYDGAGINPEEESEDDESEERGRPIAIIPVDVPLAVFNRSESEGVARELRKMIFNASGHVLGEPFWIQDDEGGGHDFIMQVNESLCDINLGDSGSLYVFGWGTVFQCY